MTIKNKNWGIPPRKILRFSKLNYSVLASPDPIELLKVKSMIANPSTINARPKSGKTVVTYPITDEVVLS